MFPLSKIIYVTFISCCPCKTFSFLVIWEGYLSCSYHIILHCRSSPSLILKSLCTINWVLCCSCICWKFGVLSFFHSLHGIFSSCTLFCTCFDYPMSLFVCPFAIVCSMHIVVLCTIYTPNGATVSLAMSCKRFS